MVETLAEIEAKRQAYAMALRPIVEEIIAAGTTSKLGIAKELNRRGIPTQRGNTWTHVQVRLVLRRIRLGTPD